MRILIRRVNEANVQVGNNIVGEIKNGMLVYVGLHKYDGIEDYKWIIKKMLGLRIFEDENRKVNLSVCESDLEILVVSQFTLLASFKKGYRPSFHNAAPPKIAEENYELFLSILRHEFQRKVEAGVFGADMKIKSVDDGPFSLWLDSKQKNY